MHKEMDEIGKKMHQFQKSLVEQYKYKKIPLTLFLDTRKMFMENLPKWCLDEKRKKEELRTLSGTPIARGYTRVVIGDYGAFVEIEDADMIKENIKTKEGQEFRSDEKYHVKYLWLTAKDDSNCKIYLQTKTVDYADYQPGRYYISPYEILAH